ncbi:MAG: glycosyltransferase family 4 protein [Lentisphaerae bacterium]|nr:glycosyltransferase family 4 protein [Lentisphaerota bacterium]
MKKLSMWTRYDRLGASSRLRFRQFIPFLEKEGFDVSCSSFFTDAYLQDLYAGKKRDYRQITAAYFRRFRQMSSLPDGVPAVIEYELLPFLPFFMERRFLKKHPYILNFDDAVYLHYARIPLLKNKYPELITNAAGIIVANDVLAEKFSRYNRHLLKLPTTPPEIIHPGTEKPERLTLVWTGTPVTYQFLYDRREALQAAGKKSDFELLIVGGDPSCPLPGISSRFIQWSDAAEAAALASAHAGIMPLPDTPFARGKSAYKLLCYLRAGIPGIASPVGENCRVITDKVNGFLVQSDDEWANAISALSDHSCRRKMSDSALLSGEKYLPGNAAKALSGFISERLFD